LKKDDGSADFIEQEPASMPLTATSLLEYLRDELGVETDDIEVATPLFSSGVIDSFALVQLITFLEERCNLRLDAADVSLENLDSIERILALVERSTQ
jgi:acyl carrier protein